MLHHIKQSYHIIVYYVKALASSATPVPAASGLAVCNDSRNNNNNNNDKQNHDSNSNNNNDNDKQVIMIIISFKAGRGAMRAGAEAEAAAVARRPGPARSARHRAHGIRAAARGCPRRKPWQCAGEWQSRAAGHQRERRGRVRWRAEGSGFWGISVAHGMRAGMTT